MKKRTIYRKLAIMGALAGTLALSGCGTMRLSSMDTLMSRTPPDMCISKTVGDGRLYEMENGKPKLNLYSFLKQAKEKNKTTGKVLDEFLDCTVANLGPDADGRLKVYRGYVTLAVLSRYAAFNYTGMIGGSADLSFQSYNGIQDDAVTTLERIDFADKMLRLGSGIKDVSDTVIAADVSANPTLTYMKTIAPSEQCAIGKLHDVEKLHRTLAVLMVAASADKPTVARARTWINTLFTAIATGTLANPGSLVDQGLKVIGKSLTLDTYGNAYLDDARCELECMAKANCGKTPPDTTSTCPRAIAFCKQNERSASGEILPSQYDWKYWANVIKDSCNRIAAVSGTPNHCAGGWPDPPETPPAPAGTKITPTPPAATTAPPNK